MYNRAELIGRLGRDPDIRTMQNGDKCATFSIATSEHWNDKNSGEKKERTEWHNIVAWRKLAEIVEKFLTKGDLVHVAGPIRTRKWQDQAGNDRYTTEIVLSGFDAKLTLLPQGKGGDRPPPPADEGGAQVPAAGSGDLDDEINF